MEIKERIKKLRTSKALTQQEFADELGIKKVLIAHWETGRANPGLENLTTICNKYKITADWLLFGKEPEEKLTYALESEVEYKVKPMIKLGEKIKAAAIEIAAPSLTEVYTANTETHICILESTASIINSIDSLRQEIKELSNMLKAENQR